jgi:hypothetical protein
MANTWGRLGLLYVLAKLPTKASSKSNQQLMVSFGKLFSQILAGPTSICGANFTAHLLFPWAMLTAPT